MYFPNLLIIYQILFLISENPCPFASPAFEVTISGLAGGEYLPLPASKGLAFPFLLTLDGYPTSPAIYAQGQRFSPRIKETPGKNVLSFVPISIIHDWGAVMRSAGDNTQ